MKHKINQLISDDGAVSPVIGVILMVAITVILAAVIGTFVLGLGDQVSQTAPQASISVDSTSAPTVTFQHGGSDDIPLQELEITLEEDSSGTTNTVTFTAGGDWATAQTLQLDIVNGGATWSGGSATASYSGTYASASGGFSATFVDEPSGQIIAEKEFEF